MLERVIVAAAMLLLGACATDRPLTVDCGTRSLAEFAVAVPATPARVGAGPEAAVRVTPGAEAAPRTIGGVLARALAAPPATDETPQAPRDLIILSGGGQWGAFGAGFLRGWSRRGSGDLARPPLPHAVTGVSTGAIQATFAFLGPRADDDLVQKYRVAAESELVDNHGEGFFLRHASWADPTPLYRRLTNEFDPYIDRIAREAGDRALLVGVVNANTGQMEAIDLVALARAFGDPANLDVATRRTRNACYAGAILASSAMPVLFRQVRGESPGGPIVYLDGGVRQSVFVTRVLEATEALPGARGRAFVLMNGETDTPGASGRALEPKLLAGVNLTRRLAFNQIEANSVYNVAATLAGFQTYLASADGHGCEEDRDAFTFFAPRFMACLIAAGESRWTSGGTTWLPVAAR